MKAKRDYFSEASNTGERVSIEEAHIAVIDDHGGRTGA